MHKYDESSALITCQRCLLHGTMHLQLTHANSQPLNVLQSTFQNGRNPPGANYAKPKSIYTAQ